MTAPTVSVPPTLADALARKGYESLTPVQEAVGAAELSGRDLLVSAQTGSGKTVGFGLAIAPTILPEDGRFGPPGAPLALVIAPTRELALQVRRELDWLYEDAGVQIASCVGGMDARDERRALDRGAHIVVGTPGRLCDHLRRETLDLTGIRAVVLDEADEMLDLGFREDLETLLTAMPEARRTLMFSATVPPAIATLARDFQKDAARLSITGSGSQHADISYQAMQVGLADADHAIVNLLRFHEARNAMIFCNTRAAVTRLTTRLANRAFPVVALSGELSQQERSHALQAMRDGRARVCVATDVAARGIDLPNLDLVIHAELPTSAETLLHRSGRTGRAGAKGISALIVPKAARRRADGLFRRARIETQWVDAPTADAVRTRDEDRMMTDPVWQEDINDKDAELAARLLAGQNPRRIAAAFVQLYMASRTAPEELSDESRGTATAMPGKWFTLSVGRKNNAEPRWILPLLCRAGGFDKQDVGAIRIQEAETFVEVQEEAAAKLMKIAAKGGSLEDGILVRALDTPPFAPKARAGGKAGDDFGADAASNTRKPVAKYGRKPPYADEGAKYKPARKDGPPRGPKPAARAGDKPAGKPAGKPFAKAGSRPDGKPGGRKAR